MTAEQQGTELAVVHAEPVGTMRPRPLGQTGPPTDREFDTIIRQADIVSRAGIVPVAYRTTFTPSGEIREDKRANVVVAALTGRTFGWDVITAMRNIHVIEGAASLKPEAMLGLIRASGHRVQIVRHPDRVDVAAQRADTGDEYATTFSFEDAVRAGLCTLKDGKPFARSNYGKPLPWEQYPVDMCQWRAVAQVARGLFPDVVLGLGYTPEELGAIVDQEGEVTIETAPMPTKAEQEADRRREERVAEVVPRAQERERERAIEQAVKAAASTPPRSAEYDQHAEGWQGGQQPQEAARTPEEAPARPVTPAEPQQAASEAHSEPDEDGVVDAQLVEESESAEDDYDERPSEGPPETVDTRTPEEQQAAAEAAEVDPWAPSTVPEPGMFADLVLAIDDVDVLRARYRLARNAGIAGADVRFVIDPETATALGCPPGAVPLGSLIMAAARFLEATGHPVRPH